MDSRLAPDVGLGLASGGAHYRAYVGPPERYDLMSAHQFTLLCLLGLRQNHSLLDIGCGSLRGGKLFIPYLLPGNYCGLEPNSWLVNEGISRELGEDQIRLKQPSFLDDSDFTLTEFRRKFDYILAQSIFTHASQTQISRCLSEARQVMGESSIFIANFILGDTDYTGPDWVYPDCVGYTQERVTAMAEEQGLRCLALQQSYASGAMWFLIFRPECEARVASLLPLGRHELRAVRELIELKNGTLMRVALLLGRWLSVLRRQAQR